MVLSPAVEMARPEWVVKQWYLDMFSDLAAAYELHEDYKFQHDGDVNPKFWSAYLCKMRKISIVLWAKLNKRKNKVAGLWPNLMAVSQHEKMDEETVYQAFKELSVFFEYYGYTKVEEERSPAYDSAVRER